MFDLKAYLEFSAQYTPFVLTVVMPLVTLWGKLGVKGSWQLLSSLATGLVVGGVMAYFFKPPVLAVDWFSLILFGLTAGLIASGLYEVGKKLTRKEAEKTE